MKRHDPVPALRAAGLIVVCALDTGCIVSTTNGRQAAEIADRWRRDGGDVQVLPPVRRAVHENDLDREERTARLNDHINPSPAEIV